MVNSPKLLGKRTQLIEEISFYDHAKGENKPCHALWDGGATSSFLHEQTALDRKLPRQKINKHTVSTLHGQTSCQYIYKISFPTTVGQRELWVLGVKDLAQHYPSNRTLIPKSLKQKYDLDQELNVSPGLVQLILGADASAIWPKEMDREAGAILFHSIVTGNKLIQGGKNIAKNKGKMALSNLSTCNKLITTYNPYEDIDKKIDVLINSNEEKSPPQVSYDCASADETYVSIDQLDSYNNCFKAEKEMSKSPLTSNTVNNLNEKLVNYKKLIHENKTLTCDICKYNTATKEDLRYHKETTHEKITH